MATFWFLMIFAISTTCAEVWNMDRILKMKEEAVKHVDDYKILKQKEIKDLVAKSLETYTLDIWGMKDRNEIKELVSQFRNLCNENTLLKSRVEELEKMTENCVKVRRETVSTDQPPATFDASAAASHKAVKLAYAPQGPPLENEVCPRGPKGQKGDKGDPGPSLSPPDIITKKALITLKEGENADMECRAKGYPVPSVSWVASRPINVTTKRNSSIAVSHAIIRHVVYEDRGIYQCKAKSVLGEVHIYIKLHVLIKPRIHLEPKIVFGRVGAGVQFPECDVIADPEAKLSWRKAYGDLPEGRHHFKDNKRILAISNAKLEDGGYYLCRAENSLGKSKTSVQLIITKEKFRMTTVPPSLEILVSTVNITCGATGYPKPVIEWYYFGQKINGTTEFSPENDITISLLHISEKGIYHCKASSGGVTLNATTVVKEFIFPSRILMGKPKLKKQLIAWLAETNNVPYSWKVCEKGGRWFNISGFQYNCGNVTPTVTIISSGENIFGGYTDAKWRGMYYEHFSASNHSFLFALKREREFSPMPIKLPIRRSEYRYAIFRKSTFGPTFGRGKDLCIFQQYGDVKLTSTLGNTYPAPGYSGCCVTNWFTGRSPPSNFYIEVLYGDAN